MIVVNNCPTNLAEIAKASKRLGCKNDTYGNNQYLCVPDLDKTSMQEFCFDGIMGIHKKSKLKKFETKGLSNRFSKLFFILMHQSINEM